MPKHAAKKKLIRGLVAGERDEAERLDNEIARLAEPGFEEFASSKLLARYLEERGFAVAFPWKHMPTAFRATAGKGRPRLGVLAEYDALPDCGAKKGAWGHGCGHNLLGTAACVGGVAAAAALRGAKRAGTVVVWGCPAEEILAGKIYMARDGAFRGDDAVVGWHPSSTTRVRRVGGSALDSLVFEFRGKTAHAAGCPHEGRSALDAVVVMDVAVNYLREHVPENVRIHMSIPEGGDAPNVVPGHAKAWYYVRARDRKQVDDVRARVVDCGRGAALATGTKMTWKRLTGGYNRLPNEAMAGVVEQNLKLFGAPKVTPADLKAVKKLGKKPDFATAVDADDAKQGRASTDEDSVSWLSPFGGFGVATWSKGVVGHHRETSAQAVLPFAHRATLRAAEVIAGSLYDLAADRKTLAKARDEFGKKTKGFRYDPLVAKNQRPPSARQ